MPKPTKGPRFGGSPAHQRIILANLASQLFQHGKITTTEAKAKRVQPLAERLIAKAKRGDLHNRRIVLATITDKGVVHTLFTEIAPKLEGRDGGYTRITKIGPRKGDNAPMAVIEIVQESIADSKKANAKASATAEPPRRPSPPRRCEGREGRSLAEAVAACRSRRRWHRRGRWPTVARPPPRGLRHQGQRGLHEVPHARVAVVRPHDRRGVVQQRRDRRSRWLRQRGQGRRARGLIGLSHHAERLDRRARPLLGAGTSVAIGDMRDLDSRWRDRWRTCCQRHPAVRCAFGPSIPSAQPLVTARLTRARLFQRSSPLQHPDLHCADSPAVPLQRQGKS